MSFSITKKPKLFILFFALIAFAVYLLYLHNVIISRFESHRWNLPSRIYSESFALYDGKAVSGDELTERLADLGYLPVEHSPRAHGQHQKKSQTYRIFLHSFDYPHEKFTGGPIEFELIGDRILNLRDMNTGESLKIAKLEPQLIASVFDEQMEDRTFVALNRVPQILLQSVIAIEDERFYRHAGLDPIGIGRAMLINLSRGRIVQGGSTLTQQMIKNFFLTHEKTLMRKFNEMLMALLVEMRYSKEEILEVYLNEIYFGQRGGVSVTGVQEASRFYFSKDVSQIEIHEAALLAALIKSPGFYSPFPNPDRALARRNLVLKKLHQDKIISKEDYEEFLAKPLPQKPGHRKHQRALYFVDFLKQQLKTDFSQDILQSWGLRIFTTLDPYWQKIAENTVSDWLDTLEESRPLLKKNAGAGLHLEGALLAIQPGTGFIRAYVGGKAYAQNQYDILSQAKRQPGSTFKPFVYLTALNSPQPEPSWTLASPVEDEPFTIKSGGELWQPENYDHLYHGTVSVREALEKSYNAATVWLATRVGLDEVVRTSQMLGLEEGIKPYPSLALGAFEVTPIELARAYTVFANNGTLTQPVAVRRVVTKEGEVLEKKSFEMREVFSSDVVYLMNQMLQGVVEHGTGRSARVHGFSHTAAGKTGTTSDHKDAWFVGYTPGLLALTWVGYKENLPTNLSGTSGALPIWSEFMKTVLKAEPDEVFKPSENIITVPIDRETGLLYKRGCSEMLEEYFIEGTEPKTYCR